MKFKTLLVMGGMLLSAIAADAQWTKPVPETKAFAENDSIYLYNVGAQAFFKGANDWGTRASVAATGYKVIIEPCYNLDENSQKDLEAPTGYYNFSVKEESKGKMLYLSCNSWDALWDDASSAVSTTSYPGTDGWGIKSLDNGNVKFFNNTIGEDFTLGVSQYVSGEEGNTRLWISSNDDSSLSGEFYDEWAAVSPEAYATYVAANEVYMAADSLYAAIQSATSKYPAIDLTVPLSVYYNRASTLEQLREARTVTIPAIIASFVEGSASVSNPQDMSSLITNATFDNITYEGWSGSGFGSGGTVGPCAERYEMTYDTYQTLSGLPKGVYKLTMDGFYRWGSIANAYATKDQKTPAYLYGTNGVDTLKTSIMGMFNGIEPGETVESATEYTAGEYTYYIPNTMAAACNFFDAGHYKGNQVFFGVTDDTASIGVKKDTKESTDWTLVDNFGLTYYGNAEEAYQMWMEDVLTQTKDYSEVENVSEQYLEAYDKVKEDCKSATSYEAVIANIAKLSAAEDSIAANVAAWEDLMTAVENAKEVAGNSEIEGDDVDALSEYVDLTFEERETELKEEGSTADVIAETAYVVELTNKATENGLKKGADVTNKIVNASFANGFTGWTKTAGNVGGLDICKDVEVYENVVDIYQEISGLPKGVYELSCQAFERPAANGSYNGTEESKVYLFMNNVKTPVQNICGDAMPEDQAVDKENCYITETTGSWPYDYNVSGYGWVPNSMDGASYAFYAGRYTQSARGLVTDGKMKLGLTSNGVTAHWVLWANFKLKYLGMDEETIKPMLDDAVASLDVESVYGSDVKAGAQALVDQANNATDGSEMLTLIDEINLYADKVTASKATFASLSSALSDFESEIPDDADETIKAEATAFYGEALTGSEGNYTEAEAEAAIDKLAEYTAKLQIPAGYKDATPESPVDFTSVIKNADIDEGATVSWLYTKNGGNGPALASGIGGTPSVEFWNGTASNLQFNVYQTIAYLPEGTYELSCDAANSLNGQADGGTDGRAYLYAAQDNVDLDSAEVKITEPNCTDEYYNYSVLFYAKEGKVTIGAKSVGTMAARWFVCDNFKLSYLGAGNYTAIENVKNETVANVDVFSISGTKSSGLQKGINIVRMSNGNVRKVLVK